MKKLLSILPLTAALCGTAHAAPYVLPGAPDALTPYDMQPVYNLEGIYSHSEGELPDTWGVRGSFNLYNNGEDTFRHQFNINLGALFGHEHGTDIFMMPLTGGYNLNIELADDVMLYMGAKAGYAFADVDVHHHNVSHGGFVYSVGAGIKFQCSEQVYFNAGYEFSRTYMSYDDLSQHSVIVGLGCRF